MKNLKLFISVGILTLLFVVGSIFATTLGTGVVISNQTIDVHATWIPIPTAYRTYVPGYGAYPTPRIDLFKSGFTTPTDDPDREAMRAVSIRSGGTSIMVSRGQFGTYDRYHPYSYTYKMWFTYGDPVTSFTDTPTYTPTKTETPSKTPTDTSTVTDTATPTKTVTDTRTNTPTKTTTDTPTVTNTSTATPTSSPTKTPTTSPTVTPVSHIDPMRTAVAKIQASMTITPESDQFMVPYNKNQYRPPSNDGLGIMGIVLIIFSLFLMAIANKTKTQKIATLATLIVGFLLVGISQSLATQKNSAGSSPVVLSSEQEAILGRAFSTATATFTPTKTQTVNPTRTPLGENQFTPTITPYIVCFVPTMLIGSPTPISMNTPIPGSYTDVVINGGSFSNLSASAVSIQFFKNWNALTPMKCIAPLGGSWPPGESVTFYDLDMNSTWQYLPLGAAATQSGSIFFLPHKTPLPMPQ
jgi:hypothetical protein